MVDGGSKAFPIWFTNSKWTNLADLWKWKWAAKLNGAYFFFGLLAMIIIIIMYKRWNENMTNYKY